jgi:serine phosphatase RsbU (regulator of sigma subunit)
MLSNLRTYFSFAFLLLILPVFSQPKKNADSIRKKIPALSTISEQADAWVSLGWWVSYDSLRTGLVYANRGLEMAQKNKLPDIESDAWNVIGTIYQDLGDYAKALDAHHKAITMRTQLKRDQLLGNSYLNISLVYKSLGDTMQSLKHQLEAADIFKKMENWRGYSNCCNAAAQTYFELDSIDRAMEYYSLAEVAAKNTSYTTSLADSKLGIAICLATKGDNQHAGIYADEAIAIMKSADNEYEYNEMLQSLAQFYLIEGKHELAAATTNEAIAGTYKLSLADARKNNFLQLARIYEAWNKPAEALLHYKRYQQLKDSLLNESKERAVREMEVAYNKEKQDNLLMQYQKQSQVQTAIVTGASIALLLLLLLLLMQYKTSRNRQRSNEALKLQKAIIEEKNKNITDSINYARKIQASLLPRADDFETTLRQGFVIFKPKDIVSGDFIWLTSKEEFAFLATADCTGHGVPGGMMSMLGSSFLSEIIIEKNISEPAVALNMLRDRVISVLRQSGSEGESKDGMDIVLYRLNKKTYELEYAAANNSFYTVSDGVLREHLPDKQPVGYHPEQSPFRQHAVQLKPGDMIYTFTDGYADQFGGPKGKKFKYKKLQQLLLECAELDVNQQDLKLEKEFDDWKGNLEQVDDVLLIGIRV